MLPKEYSIQFHPIKLDSQETEMIGFTYTVSGEDKLEIFRD